MSYTETVTTKRMCVSDLILSKDTRYSQHSIEQCSFGC